MATRMYNYRSSTFSPSPSSFTPTLQGTWDSDFSVVYPMAIHGGLSDDASFLRRSVSTAASAATIGHAIWVSPPMQSTHDWTSATCVWTARVDEALATQNTFQQFYWGIYSNDGSIVRAKSALEKGATEFPTTAASRTRTDAGGGAGVAYTNVPGDRLFVEVGWDKDAAISGSIGISYGKVGTSDLVGDGDTGTTNGWVEFSHTVTFDPEGTFYGRIPQLMMTGCGT